MGKDYVPNTTPAFNWNMTEEGLNDVMRWHQNENRRASKKHRIAGE